MTSPPQQFKAILYSVLFLMRFTGLIWQIPSWKFVSCFSLFLPLKHISAQTSSRGICVKSSSLRCLARLGVSWAKHCMFRQPKLPFPGLKAEKIKTFNRRERKFHLFRAGKLRQGDIQGHGSQTAFKILSCLIISFNGIEIISFLMVTKLFSGSRTPVGHFSWEVSRRGAVSQRALSFNHRLISPAADCHNFALSPSVGFCVPEDFACDELLLIFPGYD